MGNSQGSGIPENNSGETLDAQSTSLSADDFDRRWRVFLQSLDISSGHVKHIESLDKNKKIELLLSFESKNPLCNVATSINLLKNLDWNQILGNSRKKDSGMTLRSLLSSTEISLRTNSVDWVYEFLQCDGLEVLSDFMATCLHLLLSSPARPRRNTSGQSCNSPGVNRSKQICQPSSPVLPTFEYPTYANSENGDSQSRCDRIIGSSACNSINCMPRQQIPENIKDFLKDCLHLSLRCLKTILNNQSGCKRAFEYPQVIIVITFCLLHPNFMTKALALDLLTAMCLIEGGHTKVLRAFDHLRQVMGEGLRFEMLLESFKHHETFDVEHYNIDFAVACVQFFNIVVHSPENINLRVYLQYELYLLGLDEVLKQLKDRAGDRLVQHVEAYLDNRVDCSLLLEDAEAKESAVLELERVESEMASKVAAAKEASRLEAEAAFRSRELELSELVESLRSRIRDLNVSSWDRENAMKLRVDELHQELQLSRSEVTKLQSALEALHKKERMCTSMATSTNFDIDVNGPGLEPELEQINHGSHPRCKELKRFASMEENHDDLPTDSGQPVDQGFRVKCGTLSSETPADSAKFDTEERKTESHKNSNTGPQKPVRKQFSDQPNKQIELRSCPNNTVIRRLAAEAANTLSQLVGNNTANNSSISEANATNDSASLVPPYFIVTPSTWPYHVTTTKPSSDTLFDHGTLLKSLTLHPIPVDVSTTRTAHWDNIWSEYYTRLSEPWLSAAQQTNSLVSAAPNDAGSSPNRISAAHSFQWLIGLGLLPTDVNELCATVEQRSELNSVVPRWKLFRLLVKCTLPCLPAQRLLWQLRTEALSNPTGDSHHHLVLFDQIEIAFAQLFGSVRRPDWRFNTRTENRWFWLTALLRVNLLWQLFPAELQRITEGLSSLLAGCTSVLVNSKLPIVLQLAILFAKRVVADWSTEMFDLRFLDALTDWNLTGIALPVGSFHPPTNGGPPTYYTPPTMMDASHSGSGRKVNSRASTSFMSAFVQLLSQVAPNLLDWPAEMTHIESAVRVSVDGILERIQDMETTLDVWKAISPLLTINKETDELQYPNQLHIPSALQEVDRQLVRLKQAAESTQTVVQSAVQWLHAPLSSSSSFGTHLPQADWLAPLVRFSTAFKRCAADLEKRRRNPPNDNHANISVPSHRREHRRTKNDKIHNLNNDEKAERRHRKHRTRQLDSDGIMDDILAGLTCQPLRTDIHTKRRESTSQKQLNS